MIVLFFIAAFTFFAALPFFIAELLIYTIQPGRIFGWYGKLIGRIKNEFWYNSLGGCATCFTQRISEVTYYTFYKLFVSLFGSWLTCRVAFVPSVVLNIILFIAFASIPYYIRSRKQQPVKPMEYDVQPVKPKVTVNN